MNNNMDAGNKHINISDHTIFPPSTAAHTIKKSPHHSPSESSVITIGANLLIKMQSGITVKLDSLIRQIVVVVGGDDILETEDDSQQQLLQPHELINDVAQHIFHNRSDVTQKAIFEELYDQEMYKTNTYYPISPTLETIPENLDELSQDDVENAKVTINPLKKVQSFLSNKVEWLVMESIRSVFGNETIDIINEEKKKLRENNHNL